MTKSDEQIVQEATGEYRHGFVSEIESETIPPGLSEEIIRQISAKKGEPEWLLARRLKAFQSWQEMTEPHWLMGDFEPINYQDISYFSAPKKLGSIDEVDPEILKTFDRLGVPLEERAALAGVAVDAVVDSVSVKTTYQAELKKHGIIFCSISEAVAEHPELVQKYLGSVVPDTDNFFACLNAAAFTDGTFVYIPPKVRCPMELSTYFRINAEKTGQMERTLVVADKGSYVSYLEGCTAPQRDENQLHAAVVELVALEDAEIRYSTVQNWYPGDAQGKGGIYNFVTKRGVCRGARSKISWTQMETGSAVTWKYPSCVLLGEDSVGEFYSVAITNGHQQADTGTKMLHVGRGTKSRIVSKGVSAGKSSNTYRGIVDMAPGATGAKNVSQCDSLILGSEAAAHTYPTLRTRNASATTEHEATTSRVSEDMLYYLQQRGMTEEQATALVVSGFSREVLQKLPMEFAIEAQALLEISLEGSIG